MLKRRRTPRRNPADEDRQFVGVGYWKLMDQESDPERYFMYRTEMPDGDIVDAEIELFNPGESPPEWYITFSDDNYHLRFTDHPDVDEGGQSGPHRSHKKALAAAKRVLKDSEPKVAPTPRIAASKKGKLTDSQLKKYVKDWLDGTEGPGGRLSYDAEVMTGAQWKRRGEPYSEGAQVVVTTEGPLNYALNHGYDEQPPFRTAELFREFLGSLGYYYELGFSWSLGIYPL
jgi:hypothetical protein